MSDREAFEKWAQDNGVRYQSKYSTGEYYFGDADLAWKAWQAAQAQAVNQQLLEALQPLRFDAWADHDEEDRLWYEPCEDGSLLYYDQVVAAIAAAQQRHGAGE